MVFKSKIAIIAIATILQYFGATAKPEMDPNPVTGCPDLNPLIRCIREDKQCETETNEPCRGSEICCPNECGTSCKVPDYIVPSTIKGCPPINKNIVCVWFNEQCNDTRKPCPRGSICCGYTCGTSCVEKGKRCQPNPVKGCPKIDTHIWCIWFNEQCNDRDKPCPRDSICCGNSCGTSCIKKKKKKNKC